MPARIDIAQGALAAEELLLELCREASDAARAEPRLLSTPVRVVVPSRSLRLHLSERLVATSGARVGLLVQTLFTAAAEILDRAGVPAHGEDARIEVLARRRARKKSALREAFDDFGDGYAGVVSAVRDLLDAGFEPELEPVLLETLAEMPLPHGELRRAREVVDVAARIAEELRGHAAAGRAELLRRATEAFRKDPAGTLPTRLLVVHGFADATGRATDLLEAFALRLPTRILIDHPRDPDEVERADLGVAFTERLLARLRGAASEEREHVGPTPAPARTFFSAPGAAAEAREVAQRVRRLIDGGARPERIGIVARDLGGYLVPLGAQLARLGIPRSGLRARAPMDGAARRVQALCELLLGGAETGADRWLDALARLSIESAEGARSRRASADLRLGLRVAGAGRVVEVARLVPEEHLDAGGRLPLPVRVGVRTVEGEEVDLRWGSYRADRRKLPGDELRAAVVAARAVERRFERWPVRASALRHGAELERLRLDDLGWRAKDAEERRIGDELGRLADSLGDEELAREEYVLQVDRALARACLPPFSQGAPANGGGGVQVLDAMEARARTFDHLFLVGLNKGIFPRGLREDALLSDGLRRRLAVVLPDVPIKARGREEDRYLFAQLLSASPEVTLSWQLADDDGKGQVVSPLVERLLREKSVDDVERARPVLALAAKERLYDAREHAVLTGLAGGRAELAPRLALALSEAGLEAGELPAARARVLTAYEEGGFRPVALAPWLGFLGEQEEVGVRPDPRREPPYVTRLEGMARCPWQTALTKLVRLEEAPDPTDELPGIEPFVLGSIVHSVLERIDQAHLRGAAREGGEDLAEVARREPVRTRWPSAAELEELLSTVAHEEVRERHAPLPGLVRMLALCARPFVDRARAFLVEEAQRWPEGGVLGVEVFGRARVPLAVEGGEEFRLLFRADRVETRDGDLVLSDYKTGKAHSRKEFLRKDMPRGTHLQPMAYVLAGREHAREVAGRYLYLNADEDKKEETEVSLGPDADAHLADFTAALERIVEAWRRGTFFPRLLDVEKDKEPLACRTCRVREACLVGDSGARRAVLGWATGSVPAGATTDALRGLWELAAKDGGGR